MIIVSRKKMKPGMILRSLRTGHFVFVASLSDQNGRKVIIRMLSFFRSHGLSHDDWELVGVNAKLRGKYAYRLPEDD